MKEVIEGLKIQFRVIHALIMREILTRYGRENIGFLWLFVEPLIIVLGVTFIWKYVRHREAHGFPIEAFIFSGWMANKLWMTTTPRIMQGIQANIGLLYHRYITPLDIILSRFILEVTSLTGVFMLLTFVFIMTHVIDKPYDTFYIVLGWALMIWFAFGFSISIMALNELSGDLLQKVWSPISLLLFISSGTFFLVEWLPQNVRPYILLLPTIHNVEMIRYGFFGHKMHPYFDIYYSILCNIFLSFIGLTLFKIYTKRILVE